MKSKFDLDNLPPDQTAIPGLFYYEELASRRLATAWTEVALWSIGLWQEAEAGRGGAVIDPHGELIDQIMACIPAWRWDEVGRLS
jgi:hypothetical protein